MAELATGRDRARASAVAMAGCLLVMTGRLLALAT